MFNSRIGLTAISMLQAFQAMAFTPREHIRHGAGRLNMNRTGKSYPRNGKRECARRRRQIEDGQLRVQNGLH